MNDIAVKLKEIIDGEGPDVKRRRKQ